MIAEIRRSVTSLAARLPRPRPQMLLPALQLAGLPLWAWVWGGSGAAGAALAGPTLAAAVLATPAALHVAALTPGFVRAAIRCPSPVLDWGIAWLTALPNTLRVYYWLLPFRAGYAVPAMITAATRPLPDAPPGPSRNPSSAANRPASGASAAAPPRRQAILFLHGYGSNRGIWWPAARWFAARGHPVDAIDLHPLHGPIDDYADAIDGAVRRLQRSTGISRVALVAHSMGGLAALAWLRRCHDRGVDPGIAALVTLATPFGGTPNAHLVPGRNARQMAPGSTWLSELNHRAPVAIGRIRLTSLVAINDNVVVPPAAQSLSVADQPIAMRRIAVRRISHMRIATNPRIFRLIAALIDRPARH